MKLICSLVLFISASCASGVLYENERVMEYERRNYTYPFPSLTPNTEGMHKLMDQRFKQIEQIPDPGGRYEGFLQTINAAVLAPNFTETGWYVKSCNLIQSAFIEWNF